MRRSINVPLPDGAVDRLSELARREVREPREQATWLILEGLKRAGLAVDVKQPAPNRTKPVVR